MTLKVRNEADEIAYALVAAHNLAKVDGIASFFHLSQTETTNRGNYRNPSVTRLRVLSANGTDLPTSLVLVNELLTVLNTHFADAGAHNTALSAQIATAAATDLTSANTLANALKTAYNTGGHINAAGVHYTNDGTNTIAAATATDLTTLDVMINEMKGDLNAHLASAPLGTTVTVGSY